MVSPAQTPTTPAGVCDPFAGLSPDALVDAGHLAKKLGLCPRTIHRAIGKGALPPPSLSIGRQIHWRVRDLQAHLDRRAKEAAEKAEEKARALHKGFRR